MGEALIIIVAIIIVATMQLVHTLTRRPAALPRRPERSSLTSLPMMPLPEAPPTTPRVAPPVALTTQAAEEPSRQAEKEVKPSVAAEKPPQAGVLYIDPSGRCMSADLGAGRPLAWSASELRLDAVLAGGAREAAAVLQTLAQSGVLERYVTCVAGTIPMALRGIALRDRDDNLWGAALFLEPLSASAATPPPAASSQ